MAEICFLVHLASLKTQIERKMMDEPDYIIVGAGSSGCVLANRLSARPDTKVLLLEAGPLDSDPAIHMPKGFGKILQSTRLTWDFETTRGNAAPETWRSGRVVGGGSSVNGMVYTRGHPQDYDEWEQLGAAGWGWSNMREVFREMEDHERGDDGNRGAGGPLHVSVARGRSAADAIFIRACAERGLPVKDELTRCEEEGVGYMNQTLRRGRRNSSAAAFLKPAMQRPNLQIKTGVVVQRLLFDGKKAVGVVCQVGDKVVTFNAKREIILSAGTTNTVRLLLLSGIGPGDHLRNLGIDVVADVPGVGRNLQDHRVLPLAFRVSDHRYSENLHYGALRIAWYVAQYFLYRGGSFARGPFNALAYVKTDPKLERPDVELISGPFSMDPSDSSIGGVKFEREPGMQIIGMPLRPESRGSITLTSPDPAVPPRIEPCYLSEQADRDTVIRMVHYIRALAQTPAFREIIVAELAPSNAAQSDDEIVDCFLEYGQVGNHPAGACAMGSGPGAVVDPRLRVRGVEGLRVADCSVMPTIVSGHNNGPAMAIGWRAASLIAA